MAEVKDGLCHGQSRLMLRSEEGHIVASQGINGRFKVVIRFLVLSVSCLSKAARLSFARIMGQRKEVNDFLLIS